MKVREYSAEDMVKLIRRRFESKNGLYNQYVVLEQVADGTGYRQSRWIDVAVFAMWPMNGLTRSAFEIKTNRQDFLRELSKPEKHQWCKDSFHEFWFVAPKEVIQPEELPVNSGWMYPRGDKLCIARNAVRNDSPKLNDSLLAAFLRSAYKEIETSHKLSEKDILEHSKTHQRAKAYQEAVATFIESRTGHYFPQSEAGDIVNELQKATTDKQIEQDRRDLMGISEKFQNDIAELLKVFIEIAHIGIMTRDDMGKKIVGRFGGDDMASLESLKKLVKSRKPGIYSTNRAALIELLSRWGLRK